jgi:hypothetical protein
LRVFAILLGAAPFAFALLAAILRHDLRFLWLAIATFVGATLVVRYVQTLRRNPVGAVALAAVDLVVALFFGALAIRVMMHGLPSGALSVALFFSLCFATSYFLSGRARQT